MTAAASLLVLVAAGAALYWWFRPETPRLAVLPFENRTGDPRFDLLAEAIPDAMVESLSTMRGLRVLSASSTRIYKGSKKPLPEIGAALDADFLVDGSVYSEKDIVQLVFNVIRADNGEIVQTRRVESRNLGGILAYQGEVSRRIAEVVAVSLTREEQQRFESTPTPKGDVQLYLRAVSRMKDASNADLEAAVTLLEDYNRGDASYAPAHALLANAFIRLADRSTIYSHAESVRRAKQAAEAALKLNPDQVDAYSALARVRFGFEWDWQGGEDGFRRAIQISPNSAEVSGSFAMFLAAFQRFDEALAQAERAREVAPGVLTRSTGVAAILYYARRYKEALGEIEAALARDPSFVTGYFTRGLVLSALQRYPEAVASIEQSMSLENDRAPGRLADLARIHALAGNRAEAETILNEMTQARAKGVALSSEKIAIVHAALGHTDLAFDFLRAAMAEKAYSLTWLRVDPRWDPIRRDARFETIIEEMRLNR
jgi:TolB-like protein/Tfp pilus assembly protein PilF